MLDKAYLQNLNLKEEDDLDCKSWRRSQHVFCSFLRCLVLCQGQVPEEILSNFQEVSVEYCLDEMTSRGKTPLWLCMREA